MSATVVTHRKLSESITQITLSDELNYEALHYTLIFPPTPFPSSLLVPNILLSILLSKPTLLVVCPEVRDQASIP